MSTCEIQPRTSLRCSIVAPLFLPKSACCEFGAAKAGIAMSPDAATTPHTKIVFLNILLPFRPCRNRCGSLTKETQCPCERLPDGRKVTHDTRDRSTSRCRAKKRGHDRDCSR